MNGDFYRTYPMKTLLLFLLLTMTAAAEDWTLTDGTVYKDVLVCKTSVNAVVIMHDGKDDQSTISLAVLSVDLRRRFHYNPNAALFAQHDVKAREMAASMPKTVLPSVIPVMATTAVAPTTPKPVPSTLGKDAIRYQIKVLLWDIEEKRKYMRTEIRSGSTGAYPEIIKQDMDQIEALKSQL